MHKLELIRPKQITKELTLGILLVHGVPSFTTAELPWRDNEVRRSCIPTGTYRCTRRFSAQHGGTFEVNGVPGRSDILFHAGNFEKDTQGCILVGQGFGIVRGFRTIVDSRVAMSNFMHALEGLDEFELTIREA